MFTFLFTRLFSSLLFSCIFVTGICAQEQAIVRLTPPSIEYIQEERDQVIAAFCDRPCRTEGIRIELEQQENNTQDKKMILHCYGHGSYGISTFFGSVARAIHLLMKSQPDFATPIRVIGSGCVGLTMAIELKRKGFTQVTISAAKKFDIPSWRAGGFFVPGVGNESTPAGRMRLMCGFITAALFREVELGRHSYLNANVLRRLPVYYPADSECEAEMLALFGLMPKSELVTLDFGNGVIHTGYRRQISYLVNVVELMTQLWAQVKLLDIPVTYEEVHSFAHCPESIICNCTGAGSVALCEDSALTPTRGHFLMIKAREPLDYMLTTPVLPDGRTLYFFPKPTFAFSADNQVSCAGMVGGTFIPSSLCDSSRDKAEFAQLAERAQAFFYGRV